MDDPIAAVIAGVSGFLSDCRRCACTARTSRWARSRSPSPSSTSSARTGFVGVTGGSQGIFFGLPAAPYYPTWGIALGGLLLAWFLLSGKFGRSLRAVRDAELAAVSSGSTRGVQDRRLRSIGGVRRRRRCLARDPPRLGQCPRLPACAVDHAARGHCARRLRALFGTIFGALFIQYAPLKAEDWGLDIDLATPLPPTVTYGVFSCSCSFSCRAARPARAAHSWAVHHN